jgi:hypothetical protein
MFLALRVAARKPVRPRFSRARTPIATRRAKGWQGCNRSAVPHPDSVAGEVSRFSPETTRGFSANQTAHKPRTTSPHAIHYAPRRCPPGPAEGVRRMHVSPADFGEIGDANAQVSSKNRVASKPRSTLPSAKNLPRCEDHSVNRACVWWVSGEPTGFGEFADNQEHTHARNRDPLHRSGNHTHG